MTANTGRKPLTIMQFAELFELSESTVYNRIRDGSLPVFRIGKLVRISPEVVDQIMRGEAPNATGPVLDDETKAYITKLVDAAPALSEAQRDTIRAAFR